MCAVWVMQAAEDGGAAIPDAGAGKDAVIAAVVAWVGAAIDADRKVGALKQLQGHVWRTGFVKGQLVAQLFRLVTDWDVTLGIRLVVCFFRLSIRATC